MNEDVMAYVTQATKDAQRFKGLKLDADTERMLYLLRMSTALPAPSDAAKRTELATTAAKLEGLYGKGKSCKPGKPGKDGKPTTVCRDLQQLSEVMGRIGDKKSPASYDDMLDAWSSWHETSKEMRPYYERLVTLSNEGAKEFGSPDLGDLWRSAYDMPPAEFEKETDRLWNQVKPLYDDLHCYVRNRLSKKYGADKVPAMSARFPRTCWATCGRRNGRTSTRSSSPTQGQQSLDITKKLKEQKYDPKKLVKLGESFFTSMGMDPLPDSFWERSQFTKPPIAKWSATPARGT